MTDINVIFGILEDLDTIVQFQMDMAFESEGTILNKNSLEKGVGAALKDADRGRYLVAKVKEEVVGSLMLTREWSDWNNEWYWWIQSVYVTPEYRKQGVYKAMYLKVKDAAKENNVSQIRLYVEKTNLSAQKVYQNVGMHESHYLMFEEYIKCLH